MNRLSFLCTTSLLLFGIQAVQSADVKLTSIGPIAFGEDGVLFVSDPLAATLYAVETGDKSGDTSMVKLSVKGLRSKIAGMLGASDPKAIQIHDMAVNPKSGNVYLSVSRGKNSIVLKVDSKTNGISEFAIDSAKATKTSLPNAPKSQQSRRGNPRMSSITDLKFIDGQVYVAGLSNEEFASNLRSIQYPFEEVSTGSSIEIYHGAHGKFETRSPVRTFAAYTCTPLVRIPVASLKEKSKVRGTTIAELGNRNRPIDMVVYSKGGKDFILMANSARGIMKVDLAKVASEQPITTRVAGGGTAGIGYETIQSMEGVMQLDGLNKTHAVVLVEKDGASLIQTIQLP